MKECAVCLGPILSCLYANRHAPNPGGAIKADFVVNFFTNFEKKIFCFVVAMCDLVYDVETIYHPC